MFGYQKVGLGETEATGESTEHTIPLLDDDKNDVEGGGQTGCNVERWLFVFRRPSTLLCMSLSFFILSGMFYSTRYYLAVTDASCQRRMWPYSMRTPPISTVLIDRVSIPSKKTIADITRS